jgi:hypothetical protein
VSTIIEDIERFGKAVEAGEASLSDAAWALIDAREGGLTHRGATDLLRDWKAGVAAYSRLSGMQPKPRSHRWQFGATIWEKEDTE